VVGDERWGDPFTARTVRLLRVLAAVVLGGGLLASPGRVGRG
jgi:hypothetical protein